MWISYRASGLGRCWPTSSARRGASCTADRGVPPRRAKRDHHQRHRINQGQMPDLTIEEGSDFYFVDAADPEDGLRKLLTVARDRIPARFGLNPVRDVHVLCPMNRGGLDTRTLNIKL